VQSETVIEVADLRKAFDSGGETVTAVDGISFSIERGSCVGLLGPNGAGKTTIKMLLGLVQQDEGSIEINGIDVAENPSEISRYVGAMLEGARNAYWRLTVEENLRYFASLAGQDYADVRERHERLLGMLDLQEKAETPVRHLSRGQKQKVSLAISLARGSEIALLDEPTLGLDPESGLTLRQELSRLVDEEEMTFVVTSHDMQVIEDICDRVIILDDGDIIADDDVQHLLDLFDNQSYSPRTNSTS
jgi:ABC-2 type transport system ATP-binding protein